MIVSIPVFYMCTKVHKLVSYSRENIFKIGGKGIPLELLPS